MRKKINNNLNHKKKINLTEDDDDLIEDDLIEEYICLTREELLNIFDENFINFINNDFLKNIDNIDNIDNI